MDRSVKPGDDFYRFANGGWLNAVTIPAGQSSYGTSAMLIEKTSGRVRNLIQESATAGSIVGCVSDTAGQRLPSATVVAKGGGLQRTVVADGAGCYELKDLPPASYRVTARLLGFDNVTRDRVVVAPAAATHLDFTTRGSSICECVLFRPSLTELYARRYLNAYLQELGVAELSPGILTANDYCEQTYPHFVPAVEVLVEGLGRRTATTGRCLAGQAGLSAGTRLHPSRARLSDAERG